MLLAAHPRLYIGPREIKRARLASDHELLVKANRVVKKKAAIYVKEKSYNPRLTGHNWHLIRARRMQGRVVTLLLRWIQTHEDKYRMAVVRAVKQMAAWRYWSWIAWQDGDASDEAIFDLSYGENSATLALAYDLLKGDLSEAERTVFLNLAQQRPIKSFLRHTDPRNPVWWLGAPDCNWNPVCAGGMGMLALAFYEDLDRGEADLILKRVEDSVQPFMANLSEARGGWCEGIAYWAYGMRYAFMYLLSHESATGREHPLLKLPGVAETLGFPLDFMPRAVPSSFGDVNSFKPLPFWYAIAEKTGQLECVPHYDRLVRDVVGRSGNSAWPDEAELVLFHPRKAGRLHNPKVYVGRYPVMDWCVMADRRFDPDMHIAIRGGSTLTPHAHLDVGSFNLVAQGEPMLSNVTNSEYLDTTFSSRREEIFEVTPQAKNTLLINGVGISKEAVAKTELLRRGSVSGVRLDLTAAMGVSREERPAAQFAGRLFLLLAGQDILIIDRVKFHRPHDGRVEARFYTSALVKSSTNRIVLTKNRARLTMSFVASEPMSTRLGGVMLTSPTDNTVTGIQYQTKSLVDDVIMACLISADRVAKKIRVTSNAKGIMVEILQGAKVRRIRVTAALRLR